MINDITRALFSDDSISADTRARTTRVVAEMALAPAASDISSIRKAFASGELGIPVSPKSPRAEVTKISGPGGEIALRILSPEPSKVQGVYLHIHGGGWMVGTNDMWDGQLERLGLEAGLVCVSVEYRLAPEHVFPAAVDDCFAAALWLIENAQIRWGSDRLMIGGESAGAHLAVTTLLRLRDVGKQGAFAAASLMYGCYDLTSTPSARAALDTPILNREAIENFAANFGGGMDLRDPSISPLYADLSEMPAALFSVGTHDPLLDDSMFMYMRWLAAGNEAELAVYPGGLHGFDALGGELADAGRLRASKFLRARCSPI